MTRIGWVVMGVHAKGRIDESKFVKPPAKEENNSMNLEDDAIAGPSTVDRGISKCDWIKALKRSRMIGIRIVCTVLLAV
jgi:hypothetical protein